MRVSTTTLLSLSLGLQRSGVQRQISIYLIEGREKG